MTTLSSLLDSQQAYLVELVALIDKETDALAKQDANALIELSSQKASILITLDDNDKILANHTLKNQLKTVPELIEKVDAIKDLLELSKEKNNANSDLIERNIARLNRYAQALQMSRSTASMTYDEKGKTSSISSFGNSIIV